MNYRVAYLISKKLSEEITENETQELNDCLASDASLYETISLLEIAWKNNQEPATETTERIQKLMAQLRIEDDSPLKKEKTTFEFSRYRSALPAGAFRFTGKWLAAAAIALIIFFTWRFFYPQTVDNDMVAQRENKVETKAGNRTKVVLYDGTLVWLNGESKLEILQMNEGKTREVFLLGEAYFEVHSNPSRPFIIHTKNTRVKVTGTTLNVRDYPGEEKAETSLLSGQAEVFAVANPQKIVKLLPNQKVVFRHLDVQGNKESSVMPSNPLAEVVSEIVPVAYYPFDSLPVEKAWVNDQLTFFDESFREVANKMEKWYGVKIIFENKTLEQERLNGKFTGESLEEALQALQFMLKFNYLIKDKTIIIKQL